MDKLAIHIVEKDQKVAEELQTVLRNLGHRVTGISDDLNAAKNNLKDKQPDLFIINMNYRESGTPIKINLEVPFIYLTDHSDSILNRIETRPYGYLQRPFNSQQVKLVLDLAITRFRQEQQVARNEKKFKTLFENTGTAIFSCNHKSLILDCNQAGLNLLKIDRQNLNQDIKLSDFIKPGHTEKFQDFISQSQSSQIEKPDCECSIQDRNGNKKSVLLRSKKVPANDLWIVSATDLSSLRRAEKKLEWEQHLFANLVENIDARVYIKDTDHKFLRINQKHAEYLGLNSPEEAIDKTDYDFFEKFIFYQYHRDCPKPLPPL